MSHLTRYEARKRALLQLGNHFGIPLDIIKVIYHSIERMALIERRSISIYHENMILFKLLSSPFDPPEYIHATPLFGSPCLEPPQKTNNADTILWKKKYDSINDWGGFSDQITYEYRLPDNKGCEWAIMTRETGPTFIRGIEHHFNREKLLTEIKIIGEPNYLISEPEPVQTGSEGVHSPCVNTALLQPMSLVECGRRLKIKYLNTSPFDEIDIDYNNFNEYKGSVHENAWRLRVDSYGEASFL